jgi:hypothetical protein
MSKKSTDTLTILQTTDGRVATKTLTRLPNGGWEKNDFLAGTLFMCHQYQIDGIEGLNIGLVEIAKHTNCFVIRGAPRDHVNLDVPVYRRKDVRAYGDDAHFEESPRRSLMIDFDKIEIGKIIDIINAPEKAVEKVIRKVLPEQYHDVSFVWQLSSSAGTFDPPGILSAHAWFWLDRPIGEVELKIWHRLRAPLIDVSVFGAVQPLYTAGPIFSNCNDPLPQRIGLAIRKRGEVSLPEIDEKVLRKLSASGGATSIVGNARGFEAKIKLIGDGDGLNGFNAVLISAIASYISGKLPSEINVDWLKVRCREAVKNAPRRPGRGADIERYLSDYYLDQCIDSAQSKFGQVPIEPLYPAPSMTPTEARARIWKRQIEFLTHTVGDLS